MYPLSLSDRNPVWMYISFWKILCCLRARTVFSSPLCPQFIMPSKYQILSRSILCECMHELKSLVMGRIVGWQCAYVCVHRQVFGEARLPSQQLLWNASSWGEIQDKPGLLQNWESVPSQEADIHVLSSLVMLDGCWVLQRRYLVSLTFCSLPKSSIGRHGVYCSWRTETC